jgi:tripartite-type tricarboxylate transporter receptor subunit TctC
MRQHQKNFLPMVAIALAIGPFAVSHADTYPSRPLRMIVPTAPGSAADFVTRVFATGLAKNLGQAVIVDNIVGAGSVIAMSALARSAPDGYTIGQISQSTLVYNTALYPKKGYDSVKDFAPIALQGAMSNVMVILPGNPAKNVREIIAEIKAKPPNTFTFSSSGTGTSNHIAGVVFDQLAGTHLLHVPYKSAPQGVLAIIAGDVDLGFYNIPVALTQIRGGKLRALAVTSAERSPALPQVPTFDESGLKGHEVTIWMGFAGPAGTPPAVIKRLREGLAKVVETSSVRDQILGQGYEIASLPLATPANITSLIKDDLVKWPPIIKASGAETN